ncbi:MAG: hypothetical protein JST16_00735 [Bdellovibrionales bacterium]|nr:hypothetical protein [Bdellovibrionales bacterium]
MKALFLLLASLSTFGRPARASGQVAVEDTQFLSTWTGYQNNVASARWDQAIASEHFRAAFSLRVSNADGQLWTGNISELNARLNDGAWSVAAGRFAPVDSLALLPVSSIERLNQRVCYTPLECVRGGPIGFELTHGDSFAQISLLAVPNVYPSADVDSAGILHTTNRWADAPIQSVELEPGHVFPLRNGGQINGNADAFFKPGLRIGHTWGEATHAQLRWISEVAASHVLSYQKTRQLSFIQQPDGSAQIVITNQQDGTIEYEQNHALQARIRQGDWNLNFDSAYSRKFSGAASEGTFLAELGSDRFVLEPYLGAGVIYDDRSIPVVQLRLSESWRRWRVSVRSVAYLENQAQGWWLAPEVAFRLTRAQTLRVRANLIQARQDAYYLGDIRGNDHIVAGWTYAF